jgi:hypothetical protein
MPARRRRRSRSNLFISSGVKGCGEVVLAKSLKANELHDDAGESSGADLPGDG